MCCLSRVVLKRSINAKNRTGYPQTHTPLPRLGARRRLGCGTAATRTAARRRRTGAGAGGRARAGARRFALLRLALLRLALVRLALLRLALHRLALLRLSLLRTARGGESVQRRRRQGLVRQARRRRGRRRTRLAGSCARGGGLAAARLVLLALLLALLALLLALLSRACHERAPHSERGGRARAGARAGRVAPNAECARAVLVGTVCRAALLFVARLNATEASRLWVVPGWWVERSRFSGPEGFHTTCRKYVHHECVCTTRKALLSAMPNASGCEQSLWDERHLACSTTH